MNKLPIINSNCNITRKTIETTSLINRGLNGLKNKKININSIDLEALDLKTSDRDDSTPNNDLDFIESITIPLGIEGLKGAMLPILQKDMKIPCKASLTIELEHDDNRVFSLNFFQGFSADVKNNQLLQVVHILGNSTQLIDKWLVNLNLSIDSYGILHIKVFDQITNMACQVFTTYYSGGLSDDRVLALQLKVEKSTKHD